MSINKDELTFIQSQLVEDIDIDVSEDISYEELYKAILYRVEHLLSVDAGLLFSYLYRLDIDEQQLKVALRGDKEQSGIELIAQMILQRQMKRIETKKKYRQDPIEGWNW